VMLTAKLSLLESGVSSKTYSMFVKTCNSHQ